jgi:hypothetical protein
MATFLATGIVQHITIPKKYIPAKGITINGIVTSLQHNNFDPTIASLKRRTAIIGS